MVATVFVGLTLSPALALGGSTAIVVDRDPPNLTVTGTASNDFLVASARSRKIEVRENHEGHSVTPAGTGCRRINAYRVLCSPAGVKHLRGRLGSGADNYVSDLGRFSKSVHESIRGGPGEDTLSNGRSKPNPLGMTLNGGAGADHIWGAAGFDRMLGRGGNDRLKESTRSHGGDDFLSGGEGDDRLVGGRGDDVMRGGPGHDVCVPGPGDDRLYSCKGAR